MSDTTASTDQTNAPTNWLKGPAIEAIKANSVHMLPDGGDGIVIINFKGEFTAFQNACLHQGLPIHAGDLDPSGVLLCPWHNWCYDVRDGACLTASGAYLEQYPVRIEEGHVWVGR